MFVCACACVGVRACVPVCVCVRVGELLRLLTGRRLTGENRDQLSPILSIPKVCPHGHEEGLGEGDEMKEEKEGHG